MTGVGEAMDRAGWYDEINAMYACQFHECKNEHEMDRLKYVKFQLQWIQKLAAQNKRGRGLPIASITMVGNNRIIYANQDGEDISEHISI